MVHPRRSSVPLLVLLGLFSVAGRAQVSTAEDQEAVSTLAEAIEPVVFETRHRGTFGGRELDYRAIAGETLLRDEAGSPRAAIFSFAYLVDVERPADAVPRPVAFVWNGGPGSSSVWLHMGTFGPKRVVTPSDAADDGSPPYELADNPATPLDLIDLVFVDPVGTGFSHAVGGHENEEFWGLDEDARSIADFIRTWLTDNRRWNSPKLLIGESFGTTRAAAVADVLEGGSYGISLNGLVLVSQALDYQGSTPTHDNLRSYLTYLPTQAATAWYHGRVEPKGTLEDHVERARRFAYDEYGPALLRGSGLDEATRTRVRDELAALTGLSPEYVGRSDLRVLADRFRKELLREAGLSVGRIDSRFVGDDIDDVAERPEGDPSSYGIDGAYTAGLHVWLQRFLEVDTERVYRVSGGRELGSNWTWRPEGASYWEPSYVNVGRRLAGAMRRNPELRVLVANGYYDFATPFFDAEVTFDRHGIVGDRVTMTYYEAGHMMYLHGPSRDRFLADVRAFLEQLGF